MDVLPRQKERRAVVPARKASRPGSAPPSFMPASGILQQQLKKMSLARTRGAYPRRPSGTHGAAAAQTSLAGAVFEAALWAAPLRFFAQTAAKGYSQEASGTALEPS